MRAPLCDEPCAHRPRARWRRSNDERAPGLCCRLSLAWLQCLLRAPASDPSTPRLIADVNLMPLRFLPRLLAAVLVAATVNAAHAIGRGSEIGTLEPGKVADILLLQIPSYRHLAYRMGGNAVRAVVKRGRIRIGPSSVE